VAPYFEDDIGSVYNAADIVIARAGAGTIFEIAAKGKPAILIPLDSAANDHQRANAYEYQKTGAAIVIEQENLLPNLLVTVIENLLKEPGRLEAMSIAAKNFYQPDAAQKIASNILSVL